MNILLIYGGKSCEHDISIITACLAKGYFDGNIYSAYISEQNLCYLVPNDISPASHKKSVFRTQLAFLFGRKQVAEVRNNKIKKILNIDVVVNCCHGRCGEDGVIAGLCSLANLPLVGSSLIASAVTMNKSVTKCVLRSFGFPVVEGVALTKPDEAAVSEAEKLGYPLIVKPSTLGSSIGVSVCRDRNELEESLKVAFCYDSSVLCEKALENFVELNCAAMRSPCGKIETSRVEMPMSSHDILTFHDKYQRGEKFSHPQFAEDALALRIKKLTRDIYEKLQLGGVVRVDYLLSNDVLYVNELNSVPGSLSYGLWQGSYSPKQFGNILLRQAILDFEASEKKIYSFSSGVLDSNGGVKK